MQILGIYCQPWRPGGISIFAQMLPGVVLQVGRRSLVLVLASWAPSKEGETARVGLEGSLRPGRPFPGGDWTSGCDVIYIKKRINSSR